jgi:chromosome segregation ATPase
VPGGYDAGQMRKILGGGSGTPPEEIEELLMERRRELETQASALEDAIADLERRESLLRDSRASLERLLRLGTTDLDSRESELVQLIRELTAREERLQDSEAELARRRSELGAVELKRASVEQRERALAERESALDDRKPAKDTPEEGTTRVLETVATAERHVEPHVELVFVPEARYHLAEIEPRPLSQGATYAVDADEYLVTRVGPSPLPGDRRRCAYLVRRPG